MSDMIRLPREGTLNPDGTWTLEVDDATFEFLDTVATEWGTDHDGVLRRLLNLPPAGEAAAVCQ